MTKSKPPAKPQSQPPQQEYLDQQTELLDHLSNSQERVLEELQQFTEETLHTFQVKRDTLTGEKNSLERRRTGYFSLSVSFIVGGLLSSGIGAGETVASRFLYIFTIAAAIATAFLIFLDYSASYTLFTLWQNRAEKIIQHIQSLEWKSPEELSQWIDKEQQDLPTRTPPWIQRLEVTGMVVAFASIILWLVERLFNPNWPLF